MSLRWCSSTIVPAGRFTHRYFRRWWYWKGICQARLHRIHDSTELGLDLTRLRRIAGIPLFILRMIPSEAWAALRHWASGQITRAVKREMMIWYALGYAREQVRPGR